MAEGGAPSTTGRGKTRYLCGAPGEKCGGSLAILSAGFKNKGFKIHNSSSEAMACYRRYLISEGYTQLGPREFQKAPGEPIMFLTKQSRFGAKMRPGKAGRNMPGGRRSGGICVSK